jgi:hypothetical protein
MWWIVPSLVRPSLRVTQTSAAAIGAGPNQNSPRGAAARSGASVETRSAGQQVLECREDGRWMMMHVGPLPLDAVIAQATPNARPRAISRVEANVDGVDGEAGAAVGDGEGSAVGTRPSWEDP